MKISQNEAEEGRSARLAAADLVIEPGLRRVTRNGADVPLPGLSFDLLMALVRDAPNLVPPDRLIEQVWQGQIVTPETVTQRVKLLRDSLGDDSQSPRYIGGVRGRGYRLIPPVRSVADGEPAPRRLPAAAWIALAAVLIATVALVAIRDRGLAPVAAPSGGLAVLPFENRSPRGEDAFFADGIHDDLLTRLSRIHDLRVIARGSVSRYRDPGAPIPEIARELGVGAVLTGAVQRAGDQVRIHVQLIDAARNRQLWAETYDRSLTVENVFAIQSEISRAIASKLEITLRPAERERLDRPLTSSLEAYDAWLRGRQEMSRYSEEGLDASVEHFQAALEADPEFALAHVGLAETRLLQQRFRLLDRTLAIQLAESSAEKALALDPTLAEAFAAKGDVLRLRGNEEAAEAALRQALALNPNLAGAWVNYGWLVAEQSRGDEQMEMWRRAASLDPHSPSVRVYGAFAELRAGNVPKAEAELRALLERQPDFPLAHVLLGEARAVHGDQAGAIAHFRRALEINPNLPLAWSGLVHALLDLGADEAARLAVEDAWSVPDSPRLGASLELVVASVRPAGDANLAATLDELTKADPLQGAIRAAVLDLAAGRDADAGARLERAEPRLLGPPNALPIRERLREATCTYAFALTRTGRTERGRSLARIALAEMQETSAHAPQRNLAPAVCHMVLGQTGAVIQLLRAEAGPGRVPSGWRILAARPELAALRADRDFAALVASIRAEAERQREAMTNTRANSSMHAGAARAYGARSASRVTGDRSSS